MPLFSKKVLPIIMANRESDSFSIANIVKKNDSPFLEKERLKNSSDPMMEIDNANNAVKNLLLLWSQNKDPMLSDILVDIYRSKLFQIPDVLIPIAKRMSSNASPLLEEEAPSDKDAIIDAWEEALKCPFSQFENYVQYISDQSRFGTHQGIKGLEFPRVMVVLDDFDAHGFLFSYEKLFGAKAPSETDVRNKNEGRETSIERTRRLFYVTCSRAEESLAIIPIPKNNFL